MADLRIALPLPAVLQGVVSAPGEDQQPVPNVIVDVFTQPTDGGTPALLGTGITGGDGRYFVIIPADL